MVDLSSLRSLSARRRKSSTAGRADANVTLGSRLQENNRSGSIGSHSDNGSLTSRPLNTSLNVIGQRNKRVRESRAGDVENQNMDMEVGDVQNEGDRHEKRVRQDSSSDLNTHEPEGTNSGSNATVSMRITETNTDQQPSSSTPDLEVRPEFRRSVNTSNQEVTENLSSTPIAGRRLMRSRNRDELSTSNGNNINTERIQVRISGSNRSSALAPIPDGALRPAFNDLKALLLETQRDKRAFASTVLSQKDKIEHLERELLQKNMQVTALEEASVKNRSASTRKRNIWSQDSLSNAGIGEYQGVCLALGRHATSNASYLVSESFFDSSNNDIRRRDWRSSAFPVSWSTAKQAVQFVKLPDNSPALPRCVMARALELQFFSSPFTGRTGFLRDCLKKILSGPVTSYMNDDEKKICESRIVSHRPTVQKFRAIISDAVGNRKKIAKGTYLRLLGYHNALKCASKKDTTSQQESRKMEREVVLDRCVDKSEDWNTNYWRITEWRTLCLDVSDTDVASEMKEGERLLDEKEIVDNWFLNEASRRSFLDLQGYQLSESTDEFSNDASIITLARADAAMTTMLKMITVGGRGGVRNNGFVESYRTLLPRAMDSIINELWLDIKEKGAHELAPFIGNSREIVEDPYGNSLRDYTVVYKNLDDNFIYLLASSRYLKQHVCGWYGNIKDAHIGRCKDEDDIFSRINSSMKFDDNEASDIDDHESSDPHNSDARAED